VQWLRDGLRAIVTSTDVERLSATVPDAGGVYLVPAFVGLGAPHWDSYARGLLIGMTRDTTIGHVARATVDGIKRGRAVVYTPPLWQLIMLIVRHIPRPIFNRLPL